MPFFDHKTHDFLSNDVIVLSDDCDLSKSYRVPAQHIAPTSPLVRRPLPVESSYVLALVFFLNILSRSHHSHIISHLKMCPTWEQGTISRVPPHIQVLKLNSRFSAPQMSKPES